MTIQVKINVDDREVLRYVRKNKDQISKILESDIKYAGSAGLRKVKTTISRRSGALANSYFLEVKNPFSVVIRSRTPAKAEAVESGRTRSVIITPKPPKKYLTIPLRNDVLTPTKSKIRQSALNKLFARLKKPNGQTRRSIYNEVGIVLAKRATIPPTKGTHKIERQVVPVIDRLLATKVNSDLRRLIRG